LLNTQWLSAISGVLFDPEADVCTENPAMRGHPRFRIEASAFCPVHPLQQADDFFQGLVPKQLVPVKVAVELQQQQILRGLITAS